MVTMIKEKIHMRVQADPLIFRLTTEFCQLIYVSFFFWAFVFLLWVGLKEYIWNGFRVEDKSHRSIPQSDDEDVENGKKSSRDRKLEEIPLNFIKYRAVTSPFDLLWNIRTLTFEHSHEAWRRTSILNCTIVGTFLVNFWLNGLTPAESPRVYLKEFYIVPLQGFPFGDFLRDLLTSSDENTYGSFPSGHVALTILPGIVAMRLGYRKSGLCCLITGLLMAFVVLFLRYHYFVDVLFALPLVLFGLIFGGALKSIEKRS